jgi:FixJ family two-component response regulator
MPSSETIAAEIVCLVDDDPAVLRAIERLLASDGVLTRSFADPLSFLEYAQSHAIQLAVLDIWMEQMNGLELQTQLGILSPHTRVIIMTGRTDSATQQTAVESGAVGFFTKPFDDEQFLSAVHSALATSVL